MLSRKLTGMAIVAPAEHLVPAVGDPPKPPVRKAAQRRKPPRRKRAG